MRPRALLGLLGPLVALALLAGCSAGPPSSSTTAHEEDPVPTTGKPSQTAHLAADHELDSALIRAAWRNDLAAARTLLDRGADVNAKDGTTQSAFLIAASEGHLRLLEHALEHGGDVRSLDGYRGTALIRAAERGHHDAVGRLVQAGVDVDHVNRLGWVGLHEALVFARADRPDDYRDTVRVIVAAGGDVTVAATRDGRSPVQIADARGLSAQAALLRRAVDVRPGSAADRAAANADLLRAAEDGDPDGVALALRAGADLETRNDLRQTPLLLASAHDRTAVARLLVDLGADPDAVDHQRDTPWLVTGVTGSVEMLEILLPARPDLTLTNRFGGLSPIPASERGHVDYVRRVVRTDVDIDHVNDLGWTALLEAVILGDGGPRHQQVVRALVGAGADGSIRDRDGRTALDHARASGYDEIVRLLSRAA